MNIIESYATNCGLQIDRPTIYEKYFPVTVGDYITLHTTSKPAKTYDYWQDVVALIGPVLQAHGISILQIGGKDDVLVAGVHSVLGQTAIGQTAYILKRSKLHLGVDSFPVHIACSYNVPTVALYSNSSPKNAGPYWGDKDKQILLEPNRELRKPSYALNETPKTINTITPEAVAGAVFKLLGIPFAPLFSTLAFGNVYDKRMVEGVPNQVVDIKHLNIPSLITRMDFHFDESFLEQQMRVGRVSIVTDKPISIKLLKEYARQIDELFYLVGENSSPEFIKQVNKIGIKYHMLTDLPDEVIRPLRFGYMDCGLIIPRETRRPKATEGKDPATMFYKSNKLTLSAGKIYQSHAAYKANQPIPTFASVPMPVIDSEEFWREADHFYFLTQA